MCICCSTFAVLPATSWYLCGLLQALTGKCVPSFATWSSTIMDSPDRLGGTWLSSLWLSESSNGVTRSLLYNMQKGAYFVEDCLAIHHTENNIPSNNSSLTLPEVYSLVHITCIVYSCKYVSVAINSFRDPIISIPIWLHTLRGTVLGCKVLLSFCSLYV